MGMSPQTRDTLLRLAPLSALRGVTRCDVIGINYHLIGGNAHEPHVRALYAYKTPGQFEDDLRFLKRQYALVSYDEVARHARGAAALPARAAMLTFDDGFAECFSMARPLLLKHAVPATFFLISGALDNALMPQRNAAALCVDQLVHLPDAACHELLPQLRALAGRSLTNREAAIAWLMGLTHRDRALTERACALTGIDLPHFLRERKPFLTTEQAYQLHRDGFTLGAHTVTHPDLAALTDADATSEIVNSCKTMRAISGDEEVPLSMPFNGSRPSRALLARIRAQHPVVGLYFNNCGFLRDHPAVIGRMSCDDPSGARSGRSNLPRLLKRAYARGLFSRAPRER